MHGAQAVMPGVACLYRCVRRFRYPDFTDTDNFGITFVQQNSPAANWHITPDFCLMRWERIVFISGILYSTEVFICLILALG